MLITLPGISHERTFSPEIHIFVRLISFRKTLIQTNPSISEKGARKRNKIFQCYHSGSFALRISDDVVV